MNSFSQEFGREKYENRAKFIGSNLVILCYKEFEKFPLCKSVANRKPQLLFILSQLKAVMH